MRGYTVAKCIRIQHSRGYVGDLPFHKSVQPSRMSLDSENLLDVCGPVPLMLGIGVHAKGTTAGEMPQCAALETNTVIRATVTFGRTSSSTSVAWWAAVVSSERISVGRRVVLRPERLSRRAYLE